MKPEITLRRILHRDRSRIAIMFDYDKEILAQLKTIGSLSWSNTNRCWYADDNEETLRQILLIFRDSVPVDISALAVPSAMADESYNKETVIQPQQETEKEAHLLREESSSEDEDIIPSRRMIKRVGGRRLYDPVEFRIDESSSRIVIRFTGFYDKDWIEEMKSYGRLQYNKFRREFSLPWSVLTVDSLSDYFSWQGITVSVVKNDLDTEKKKLRKEEGDEIRRRLLGDEAKDALVTMEKSLDDIRYSDRTNETYVSLLELFFKYFSPKGPFDITSTDVSLFIHEFVIKNGYSASYQNQMVSAIKYFYSISGKGLIDIEVFERPRRSRALPKVFSKDEVKRILNSSRNNKHKLLLWIIYSCGLRRTEVTNIRLTDLDRDRKILHIREGKGRVDRIVPVSDKVWEKLDEYIDGFTPAVYLFEGQSGGRYSSESVYRVFKQALRRAGIKKDVGVHSLRHSYATHLHESGLDIRYIQELLGHRSTRTTEIYTHVSRRNLISVRSPIEDLDLK